MRHLIFERLRLYRFRSFDESVEIDFILLGSGLHYLRGINEDNPRLEANGAGKSSIWDGLLWTLYGRTSAGLKNTDIVPWNGAKGTSGTVDLYVNSQPHRIERRSNPNGLLLDGRDVAQPAIDKLIGFSFSVMTHALIFGQGRPLLFDLEPKRKLELFDEVLDLSRWLIRSERAAKTVVQRQQIEVRLEADIESVEREQDSLESQRRDLLAHSKKWEAERHNRIRENEDRLEQWNRRRAVLQDHRDRADLALDSAGTNLKFLRTDIAKAEHHLDLITTRVNAYKVKVEVAGKEMARLERLLRMEGDCPTCGQPIRRSLAHRRHIEEELDRLDNIQIPARLLDDLDDARDVLRRLQEYKQANEEKEMDARDILGRCDPEFAALTAQIQTARRIIDERAEEGNPYNRQMADLRMRTVKLSRERSVLSEDLILIRRKIARARFWVQGFREVRLYIIDEVLQELELTTNVIVDAMGLVDWEVRYDVEKTTGKGSVSRALHVTILSPGNDKAVRWEVWSGGEAQRLKIAGSLALGEVLLNHAGVRSNLEVLDEPSRGMSRVGIGDLCDFLSERAARLDKSIVLTDHHALSTGRFKSTLTVVKDRQGSFLDSPP
jgi:DNA repair exonuclease SbcCD ATPase subunit